MSKISEYSGKFIALILAVSMLLSTFSGLMGGFTAFAAEAELLKNGSFEAVASNNIPQFWMPLSIDGGTGTVGSEYNAERNGMVVKVTADYMYAVSTMENYGIVEVKPSTDYHLSYYVKMSGENVRNRVYIRQHSESMGDANENAYYFLQQYEQLGECGWKKVDAYFTTASNCKYVYIWLVANYGTVYFDDASLVELERTDESLNSNGDFELGENGGMPVGYSGLNVDGGTGSVYKADGMGVTGAAAKIVPEKGTYALKNADDNPMKVKPSTSYRLTYSVKIPGEGTVLNPFIRQNTASMGDTSENTYYPKYEYGMTGPCDWVQINVDFVTAPDAANLYFWLIADGGEVYIDNLSLYEYEVEKEYGVKNPDFERVGVNGLPEGWVFSSSVPGIYSLSSEAESYDGRGVKVTAISDNVAFCQLQQGENIEVKPNTNYQLSYYLKTTDAELMRQYVTVRQFTESGADTPINTYLTPKIVYGNTDWKEIIFEFKTEETTAKINLWFIFTLASEAAYEGSAGASAFYDKVALKEIEPYTAEDTLGFDIGAGDTPSGWSTVSDAPNPSDISFERVDGIENKAFMVKHDSEVSAGGGITSSSLKVEPSTAYELSYWMKSGGESIYQYAFFHQVTSEGTDAENSWLWPSTNFWQYGESEWKQVKIPFVTSRNAAALDIRLYSVAKNKGEYICYDSVKLTKLSEGTNFDFEETTADGAPLNWYYAASNDADAKMNIDSSDSYTGQNSLHIVRNSGMLNFAIMSANYIPVTAGEYYEISFFTKSRNAVNSRVKVNLVTYGENDTAISTISTIETPLSGNDTVTDEWKQYKMNAIVPAGSVKGIVNVTVTQGTGELWIDHITVKRVRTASEESVYSDDFAFGTRDGGVAGWKTGGGSLDNEQGAAKLTAANGKANMSAKMTAFLTDYVYRISGRYKTSGNNGADIYVKYFDTDGREMTSLVNKQHIAAGGEYGEFEVYVKTPSCTTAELGFEITGGTLSLDDVNITVSDYPTTSSDWEGKWVWYPENASISAVRVDRFFRYSFELDSECLSAILQITCDDKFELYINGTLVDSETSDVQDTWKNAHVLDIAKYLKKGKNTFAVKAYNLVSSAGLLFDARIDMPGGIRLVAASGDSVVVSDKYYEGWTETEFDDSGWLDVMVIGAVPVLPWSNVAFDNSYFVDAITEIISAETEERETECGDYAYIDLTMKLEREINTSPDFKVYLWKRNTYTMVTSSEFEIADGSDPKNWPVGKEFTVKFRMKVPDFINAGRYTLQFDQNNIAVSNSDVLDNKFMDMRVTADDSIDPVESKVEQYNGKPTLMLNGIPTNYLAFLMPVAQSHLNEDAAYDSAEKAGLDLFMNFNGLLSGTASTGLWKRDGSPNYDLFDRYIYQSLAFNPDGYLMLHFDLAPPDWWIEEHPDEMTKDENGTVTGYSLSSKLFRKEAGEILKLLLEHAKQQRYYSRIYGVRVTGAKTSEWLHYGPGLNHSIDYSVSAQNGFREYLKEKYKTDAALRSAWNNSTVTLETAKAPTYEERTTSEYISILDPETQKNIIDFQDFMGGEMTDAFLYFAEIAKKATDGKLIVGGYHGYIWNAYSYEGNDIMHSHVQKVFDSPYVDFISGPACYNERDLGLSGAFMAAVDSVHANGKLYIQEQDNRTVVGTTIGLTESDSGVGKTYTMEDSINQLKRDVGSLITKGAGAWFYDMDGGWFHDDQIYELQKKLKEEGTFSIHTDRKSTSDIAVFVDETNYQPAVYDFGKTYQIYHYLYLMQRFNLGTAGAPYDIYMISDLQKGIVPDYKVNIVLSPFQLDDTDRKALNENLKRDNKTVIWIFAPGISDGNQNNIDYVSALTGFELEMQKEICALNVTISDTESPYTEGINGISYGNNEVGVGPYIKVVDDNAKALGYLNGGSDIGLAVKDMGSWTSVYSSAPNIPNRLIRNILKESGGHIYSTNSDDIVFANNHYVTIHSAFAGKRTISLPEKVSVYDVYADKFVSMNTDKIEIELKDGETRMYRLMSPNKYSVLVHSNSGGSISPFGITEVSPGAALDITVKADSGYYVEKLLINGETADVQKENIHLSDIRGNVTVEAVFAKLKTAKPPVEEEIPPPEEEGSTDITYENVVRGDEPEQEQTEESSGKVKKYKKVIVTYPEGLPVWAIVLIAAGGVLLAGGGVFFVILLRRKKKKTQQ